MLFENNNLYPKLKLPEMTAEDALVIGSGPSFDDFEISEIQNCQATKYGSGQIYQSVNLDYYFLIDHGVPYLDKTKDIPTSAEIWTTRPIYDCTKGYPYHARMNIVTPDLHYSSAGTVALHFAIKQQHRRVFILGIDGEFDKNGDLRTETHAKKMKHGQTPEYGYQFSSAKLTDHKIYSMPVHVTTIFGHNEIMLAKELLGDKLINLSTCSNYINFLGVSQEVDEQKFGHIDKHSSLIAIQILRWCQRLETSAFLSVANFFAERDRRQAIVFVVNDIIDHSVYAQIHDANYLLTHLSTSSISSGFAKVQHIFVA